MENFYQKLGVLPSASPQEVKEAYTRQRAQLAKAESGEDELISEELQALDEAYAILIDPGLRAAYDRSVGVGETSSSLVVVESPDEIVLAQQPSIPLRQVACPHCGTLNPSQSTICSQCQQQISRPCPNCGNPVILNQSVCPRCETVITEYDQRHFVEAKTVEQKVRRERIETKVQVRALEEGNRRRGIQEAVFCLALVIGCVALAALASYAFNYF